MLRKEASLSSYILYSVVLTASDRERIVILGSGSVVSPKVDNHLTNIVGPASSSQGN